MNQDKELSAGWDRLHKLLQNTEPLGGFKSPLTSARTEFYRKNLKSKIATFEKSPKSFYHSRNRSALPNIEASSYISPTSKSNTSQPPVSPNNTVSLPQSSHRTQKSGQDEAHRSIKVAKRGKGPRNLLNTDRTRSVSLPKAYYHDHKTQSAVKADNTYTSRGAKGLFTDMQVTPSKAEKLQELLERSKPLLESGFLPVTYI